jgi:outer membrane protein assembly factor BamB
VAAGAVCLTGSSGVGDYGLFAFDAATGRPRWTYRTDNLVQGNAVTDGRVCYFADGDSFLCAVDATTGGARWRVRVNDLFRTASPVAGGGLVLVQTQGGGMGAFDSATGRRRWEFSSGGTGAVQESRPDSAGAMMVAGRVVYVGGRGGTLTVLDARTGARRWSSSGGGAGGATASRSGYLLPALGGGLAVRSDPEGRMEGLDAATGRVRWRQSAGKGYGEGPLVVGTMVYQGALDGLYGFDLATGRARYRLDGKEIPDRIIGSAQNLAAVGTTVYCAIDSKMIYAVRPS